MAVRKILASARDSPRSSDDLLRERTKLSAIQFLFPAGPMRCKAVAEWECRKALRLLPGDAGFLEWRKAKTQFRRNLCVIFDDKIYEDNPLELGTYESDDFKEIAAAFLDAECPPVMMGY